MTRRFASHVLLVLFLLAISAAAHAGEVASIRIHDQGPFQIWNGIDAGSSDPNARVLAVIGSSKSLRIGYDAREEAPAVSFGPGWAEVDAGRGTALGFSIDTDCHPHQILYCTNEPIEGIPKGAILCMCTGKADDTCCESDTGIYTKSITLKKAHM